MLVCLVQIISRLDNKSKFQTFTLFSGRHVGVPRRYTNMADPYALCEFVHVNSARPFQCFAPFFFFRAPAPVPLVSYYSLDIVCPESPSMVIRCEEKTLTRSTAKQAQNSQAFQCSWINLSLIIKLNNNDRIYKGQRKFYSCVLSYLAMNASEAGGDHALIQTSQLFSCKWQLVSIRRTWFAQ